jgi:hypothetical protein
VTYWSGRRLPNLKSVPFIQEVLPLVKLQLQIEEECTQLATASANLSLVAGNSSDATISQMSHVFTLWAKSFEDTMNTKNRMNIQEVCRFFEGDDVDDDERVEESDDEYYSDDDNIEIFDDDENVSVEESDVDEYFDDDDNEIF